MDDVPEILRGMGVPLSKEEALEQANIASDLCAHLLERACAAEVHPLILLAVIGRTFGNGAVMLELSDEQALALIQHQLGAIRKAVS